jgi:predicted nuclease of predicted toxin-antitoxin system
MRFFFDNNLPPRLVRAIVALEGEHGSRVVHLKDKFDQGIADEQWMNALGEEGDWVVLTHDVRITRNPHELAALEQSGLTVFIFAKGWLDIGFWEQAWQLIKRWPGITSIARRSTKSNRYRVKLRALEIEEL